jgi:hypothetical protein
VGTYRALPSSPFETLALSSAAELVGVARPRCGGSVTRESDISNGENGDISIGGLQRCFAESPLWNRNQPRFEVFGSSRERRHAGHTYAHRKSSAFGVNEPTTLTENAAPST